LEDLLRPTFTDAVKKPNHVFDESVHATHLGLGFLEALQGRISNQILEGLQAATAPAKRPTRRFAQRAKAEGAKRVLEFADKANAKDAKDAGDRRQKVEASSSKPRLDCHHSKPCQPVLANDGFSTKPPHGYSFDSGYN